jgi:hypothetical protein
MERGNGARFASVFAPRISSPDNEQAVADVVADAADRVLGPRRAAHFVTGQ